MVDSVFRTRWPPLAALVAATTVFLCVLLTTPPGPSSLVILLIRPSSDAHTVAAAYAVGAAAFLALCTLIGIASLGSLAAVLVALVRMRRGPAVSPVHEPS